MYNDSVKLWLEAKEKLDQGAELMCAGGRAKKTIWGQFWSAEQVQRMSVAIGLSLVPRIQNTIGAGFSGHDFKMVVGNVLSQLAVDEKVKNDILPLRLSRFSGFKEVKSNDVTATHSA
ncbi:uncharacterized protein [Acropora muricata]|uniref:uncharacterized protein n=1 Tax=Acropora muricata TaxID=159855 RepID=UPI0034E5FF36